MKNFLIGALGALALGAILFFGARKHEAPAPKPVPVVVEVAPLPTPAPVKVAVPAPTPKKVVVPLKITPPAAKKPPDKAPDKSPDMSLSCRAARAVTAGKTPAQLQQMREHYGTSDEEIAKYKHCF